MKANKLMLASPNGFINGTVKKNKLMSLTTPHCI